MDRTFILWILMIKFLVQVIVACRHLVSANQPETLSFRYKMVGFMDELLDENVLIGGRFGISFNYTLNV